MKQDYTNTDKINIDRLSRVFYRRLLPVEKINAFLHALPEREVDAATDTLMACFDIAVARVVLANCSALEQKQQYLRLCQDDYANPEILDFLIDAFTDSETILTQAIQRTLVAAQTAIK